MQKNGTLKNDTKNEHKPIQMIADTEKTKGKQKNLLFYLTEKKRAKQSSSKNRQNNRRMT